MPCFSGTFIKLFISSCRWCYFTVYCSVLVKQNKTWKKTFLNPPGIGPLYKAHFSTRILWNMTFSFSTYIMSHGIHLNKAWHCKQKQQVYKVNFNFRHVILKITVISTLNGPTKVAPDLMEYMYGLFTYINNKQEHQHFEIACICSFHLEYNMYCSIFSCLMLCSIIFAPKVKIKYKYKTSDHKRTLMD